MNVANFQLKGQRSGSPDVTKLIAAYLAYMFTYGRQRRRLRRQLQTRPNPLLGLIYCRRLTHTATWRTAAYHVGTRRRHIFFFSAGQRLQS